MGKKLMDLKQLEYFMAIAHEGSISGAARKIRVAQPTLSQQLRNLEDELGEPLLQRKPRGVEPTAAGMILLEHAKLLIDESARLRNRFDKRREIQQGRLTLGIIPTIAPYLLNKILPTFRRSHPQIDIRIREAKTNELIQLAVDGSIEFAITSDISGHDRKKWSLTVRELFRETLVLAAPRSSPIARSAQAPKPADLDTARLIHLGEGHCLAEQTRKLCHTIKGQAGLECDQLETAMAMVAAEMGCAIVPELSIRSRNIDAVSIRPFSQPTPERRINLVKKRAIPLTNAAKEFVSLVGSLSA
jgi:LysR family hydrogen peroxide-inducible transcriptional activator